MLSSSRLFGSKVGQRSTYPQPSFLTPVGGHANFLAVFSPDYVHLFCVFVRIKRYVRNINYQTLHNFTKLQKRYQKLHFYINFVEISVNVLVRMYLHEKFRESAPLLLRSGIGQESPIREGLVCVYFDTSPHTVHSPVGPAFVGVEVELSVVLYKCSVTQQLFC